MWIYFFGRKFTLVTDNQPLTTILGQKKGIPSVAAYGKRVTLLPYESVGKNEVNNPNLGDDSSIKRRAKQ